VFFVRNKLRRELPGGSSSDMIVRIPPISICSFSFLCLPCFDRAIIGGASSAVGFGQHERVRRSICRAPFRIPTLIYESRSATLRILRRCGPARPSLAALTPRPCVRPTPASQARGPDRDASPSMVSLRSHVHLPWWPLLLPRHRRAASASLLGSESTFLGINRPRSILPAAVRNCVVIPRCIQSALRKHSILHSVRSNDPPASSIATSLLRTSGRYKFRIVLEVPLELQEAVIPAIFAIRVLPANIRPRLVHRALSRIAIE